MKKKYAIHYCLGLLAAGLIFLNSGDALAQTKTSGKVPRPKLVVGIVVDQMRWDYLYRYYDRYSAKGFRRMLGEGFTCENTFINYLPSATAVGHSTIYSGSVPAIHGITGNDWIDRFTGKSVYCTADSTVQPVGAQTDAGKMSPRNLLASTVTDELRLATNFRSKVVSVSLKDRASILPAGHNPTAAFWLDDESGKFITSNYYMNALPAWVNNFNDAKPIEKLLSNGWNTLYPIQTYKQSTADDVAWEGKFKGESRSAFPHDMANIYKTSPGSFRQTPFGNTLTLDFAKAAIDAYQLGKGTETDFLTINCASTDYVGHMFGPNSIEVEDVYLRLDRDLGLFFDKLDAQLGKGNYLVFLTADHGASHSIGFNQQSKIPADILNNRTLLTGLNKYLGDKYNVEKPVRYVGTYQVYFNHEVIEKKKLDLAAVKQDAMNFLRKQPGIGFAVDFENIAGASVPENIKTRIINGYNFKRNGDIQIVTEPGWFSGSAIGTNHGTYSPYDTHIPLVFMGWGVKHGSTNRETYMTDIAPTVAAFLRIQMPNGTIGTPIGEVLGK
ncbi:alkaline phosphatase family protein [Pedobacter yulinensis]|uniref:Alkaline phosphatase family protein n=1 Tax=Pedobacter yulinensis TaxID=2126353 RepID=A0A2T3HPF6_9SPHI|nr:alkaline phosphatase PafA [Pedobacter yulinensis]PST84287.1 alkaline phosphatase family protein [Pedobacter yulinensis]